MPRRRSLSLRGLFIILAILAAVAVAERIHIIPPGTLDRLLGQETHRPRQQRKQEQVEPPPPAIARATDKIDYADVARQLDGIRVEPEKRRGYDRDAWPHWLALEGGCLNAREKVLIRDSRRPATLDAKGCGVKSGDWTDPYTGEHYTDPQMVDIDHRVPLEEAYASGGYDWSREKRAAYANDTSDPLTLLVSSREANRAKGSKGPEEWLPPKHDATCLYVADWILVKARWSLSMDERERVTVGNILNDCRASAAQQR